MTIGCRLGTAGSYVIIFESSSTHACNLIFPPPFLWTTPHNVHPNRLRLVASSPKVCVGWFPSKQPTSLFIYYLDSRVIDLLIDRYLLRQSETPVIDRQYERTSCIDRFYFLQALFISDSVPVVRFEKAYYYYFTQIECPVVVSLSGYYLFPSLSFQKNNNLS